MPREKVYVCPKCKKIVPFLDADFCNFCGEGLTEKDLRELPICPPDIPKGHCDECKAKKAKECDDCRGTKEVENSPEFGHKCLCENCRIAAATVDSLCHS